VENKEYFQKIINPTKKDEQLDFTDEKKIYKSLRWVNYLPIALAQLQKIAKLQSKINKHLGPLLLLDFTILVIMISILGFLPIKYFPVFRLQPVSYLTFGGNFFCYLARLVILVIWLGNVFPAGVDANMALADTLISPHAQHIFQSAENSASVLAYLSVYSANPVCFTAWDFFPITKNTLLVIFSVISTYIVIVLQMSF